MKHFIFTLLIVILSSTSAFADVYNYSPFDENPEPKMDNSKKTYSTSNFSKIGDTYYLWNNKTQTYNSYKRDGNDIYGSNGSHYIQSGNMLYGQNNNPKTYQINGSIIRPVY